MSELRIILNELDFGLLVRGKVAKVATSHGGFVEVVLSDIGWDRMYFQLERAMRDAGVETL